MKKRANAINMKNYYIEFHVEGIKSSKGKRNALDTVAAAVLDEDDKDDEGDEIEMDENEEDDGGDLGLNPYLEDVHEWILDYIDSLCDVVSTKERSNYIQFTSPVGLAKTVVTGLCIGALFTFHLTLFLFLYFSMIKLSPRHTRILSSWSLFVIVLCIYHCSEFFTTARYNPSRTSYNSFLINQGKAFTAALTFAVAEFWVEAWLLPDSIFGFGWYSDINDDHNPKQNVFDFLYPFQLFALVVIIIGQTFRTLAMVHAGPSFTHMVQYHKREEHELIKHGVFRYFRHPSYFGWFYWSIATQILLVNPISVVGYAAAAWIFFRKRIAKEERLLFEFFGEEYVKYRKSTFVGIPFVGTETFLSQSY